MPGLVAPGGRRLLPRRLAARHLQPPGRSFFVWCNISLRKDAPLANVYHTNDSRTRDLPVIGDHLNGKDGEGRVLLKGTDQAVISRPATSPSSVTNHSLTITRTSFLRPRACHVPTSVSATMAGFSGLRFRRVRDAAGDGSDGDQTAAEGAPDAQPHPDLPHSRRLGRVRVFGGIVVDRHT